MSPLNSVGIFFAANGRRSRGCTSVWPGVCKTSTYPHVRRSSGPEDDIDRRMLARQPAQAGALQHSAAPNRLPVRPNEGAASSRWVRSSIADAAQPLDLPPDRPSSHRVVEQDIAVRPFEEIGMAVQDPSSDGSRSATGPGSICFISGFPTPPSPGRTNRPVSLTISLAQGRWSRGSCWPTYLRPAARRCRSGAANRMAFPCADVDAARPMPKSSGPCQAGWRGPSPGPASFMPTAIASARLDARPIPGLQPQSRWAVIAPGESGDRRAGIGAVCPKSVLSAKCASHRANLRSRQAGGGQWRLPASCRRSRPWRSTVTCGARPGRWSRVTAAFFAPAPPLWDSRPSPGARRRHRPRQLPKRWATGARPWSSTRQRLPSIGR